MARRPSEEPHAQAHRRAQRKYRQTPQGGWVIRTDSFGVRPVDLVSRAPDRLKEFTTLDEAVRFEMACYEAKQQGADPAQYHTIPKKNLDLPTEQRALDASLKQAVAQARDHLDEGLAREADALHARHDETQHELRRLRASIEATVVPIIGPDEARATPAQLKKRKAAHVAASAKAYDAMIEQARIREAALQQLLKKASNRRSRAPRL